MTIFISCSLADKDIFDELAEYLRQRGHIIYPRSGKYLSSLLITSLRKDIAESDFFVALISENFSNSKIALTEFCVFYRKCHNTSVYSGQRFCARFRGRY